MIKIILTFDYELPLGGVTSYEKGLFEPAEKIINLGKELNVPFCFFADICSAIKFKKWDKDGYYKPFIEQLQKALRNNHDVQLHIHPHWLTSDYKNETFIPSKDYSLSNFADIKGYSINSIIESGIKELNEICQVEDKTHRIVAYRAGGYSISNRSDEIFKALQNNGILIDSSILPNYYLKTPTHTIDFKGMLENNWTIDGNVGLYEKAKTGVWEIPITNMPVSFMYILKRRMNKIINKSAILQRKYDNTGRGIHSGFIRKSPSEKIKEFFNPVSLSFDGNHITVKDLEKIVSYNLKKFKKKTDTVYVTTISHPKSMGNYNISLLKGFIIRMQQKYGDEVKFISYKNLI